jgi:hypothetical protein
MEGILPKGPGVGPDSTLPGRNRSRNGSRALPFKVSLLAGVGDSGSTRHVVERGKEEEVDEKSCGRMGSSD